MGGPIKRESGSGDGSIVGAPAAPPARATRPPVTEPSLPIALLDRYGPDAAGPPPSRDEAWAHVHQLATGRYENFSVLSRLVPQRLRDDFAAFYAFCRWSDDLGDELGAGEAARQRSIDLLAWWRRELHACFARAGGDAEAPMRHPVFIALHETIRRHTLPVEPFDHLIDAFEQDQRVTRYGTWDELVGYCSRSANPVGNVVLRFAGHLPEAEGGAPGSDELFAMSDATCSALQLINFWQDVRRDLLERDRVYVPSEETGVTAEMLRDWLGRPNDPEARVPYIKAIRPLVDRTAELFARGSELPGRVQDRSLRPVIWLFGAGGEAVLRRVRRMGGATLWHRPTLPKWEKAALVGRAWVSFCLVNRAAGTSPAGVDTSAP